MGWIERLRGIPMTGPEAFWRSGVAGADPAALDGVFAVGATDGGDARMPFSNFGAAVDLGAPGAQAPQAPPAVRDTLPDAPLAAVPLLSTTDPLGPFALDTPLDTHTLPDPPDADVPAGCISGSPSGI